MIWRFLQVNIYVPQTGNAAFGVVRAMVKDSSDTWKGNSSMSYIDSDGRVRSITI